jgi:hypothetical protein
MASALMNSTRGPTTEVWRGTLAASSVGASDGATGMRPVEEMGAGAGSDSVVTA